MQTALLQPASQPASHSHPKRGRPGQRRDTDNNQRKNTREVSRLKREKKKTGEGRESERERHQTDTRQDSVAMVKGETQCCLYTARTKRKRKRSSRVNQPSKPVAMCGTAPSGGNGCQLWAQKPVLHSHHSSLCCVLCVVVFSGTFCATLFKKGLPTLKK